jgi:hypothetical protein
VPSGRKAISNNGLQIEPARLAISQSGSCDLEYRRRQLRSWVEVTPRHNNVRAEWTYVYADLDDREKECKAGELGGRKHPCEHQIPARKSEAADSKRSGRPQRRRSPK